LLRIGPNGRAVLADIVPLNPRFKPNGFETGLLIMMNTKLY
jgi:hypothetical protein